MGITQNYSSTSGGRYFVGAVVNGRITSTSISYETSGSTMGSRQSCSSAGDGGNSGAVANDRTTSISMVQNLSAAELTGTLTQFECFPGLPAEIRVMIWKASMPGARVIDTPHLYINFLETKYPDSYRFVGPETPSSRKAPALLHACKESRIEALKTYKLLEITGIRLASRQHNFAAKFYIDYEKDTVFFNVLAAHLESPPIWRSGYPIPIPNRDDYRPISYFAFRATLPKIEFYGYPEAEIIHIEFRDFMWAYGNFSWLGTNNQPLNPESIFLVQQHFAAARRLLTREAKKRLMCDERFIYVTYTLQMQSRIKKRLPVPRIRMMMFEGKRVLKQAKGLPK